jgi:hypothetical protein
MTVCGDDIFFVGAVFVEVTRSDKIKISIGISATDNPVSVITELFHKIIDELPVYYYPTQEIIQNVHD